MAPRTRKDDLTNKARFIFQGVVTKVLGASKDKAEEQSVVVKVDSVVRAPSMLTGSAGNSVTVLLAPGEKIAGGEHAVFYTNPASWGDTVSVRSLGHTAAAPEAAGHRMMAAAKPLHDQHLEDQVQAADLVLTGTVSAVRLPPEQTPSAHVMAAKSGLTQPPQRISEHDPLWREAVIDVHDVHKGNARKQVVIRFPGSTDVRWHKAPKFRPGQQGVWLLHKKDVAPSPGMRAAMVKAAGPAVTEAYTALNPADFQPIDQVESIKTLIKASKPNK